MLKVEHNMSTQNLDTENGTNLKAQNGTSVLKHDFIANQRVSYEVQQEFDVYEAKFIGVDVTSFIQSILPIKGSYEEHDDLIEWTLVGSFLGEHSSRYGIFVLVSTKAVIEYGQTPVTTYLLTLEDFVKFYEFRDSILLSHSSLSFWCE